MTATVAASVSGTLRRLGAGGSPATGTLSSIGYSTGGATGTLAVDRALFLAFYSRVRGTRPDVFVADELMRNLVETVEIDSSLSDPIGYANFTLSDKRVAFFDPASVSNGERDVLIDFWAGPFGAVRKWRAFLGTTDTSQNTMPYRPRGVFRSVSLASKWADRQGCLNVPAFSELTRGEIIAAFAETAGVIITNAAQLGGGIVRKPLDIAGKTPFQLIQEYGEVEGWFARTTADGEGLEIISEDQMLTGAPVFAFDESNTFDVPETCPDRPVTDWILSTTRVAPASGSGAGLVRTVSISSGVDDGGHAFATWTDITTDCGVEISRIVTQFQDMDAPGIVPAPGYYIVNRVTTDSTYAPFSYVDAGSVSQTRPSTMLTARYTKVESLSGIQSSDNTYEWASGGWWTESLARLLMTQEIFETFVYSPLCFQESALVVTYGYYSPLLDPVLGGSVYSDGSNRADTTYTYREISRVEDHFQATDTGFIHTKATAGWSKPLSLSESYNTAYSTTDADSPPVASASVPQFAQQVVTWEVDATAASGYSKITSSPGAYDFVESVEELDSIARRKIRRAFSDRLSIPHNAIPYLREGDHVTVTNHARSLVAADAYVESIKRTADVTNGAMRQVTAVCIPPNWI